MPGASLAAIVVSLHGRCGKTLLARTLVDYFLLSGGRPYIYDTDAVERGLHVLFPADARVIDLAIVRDQMLLFEALAKPSPQARIVDVTHRSLTKFFELLRDTDFILEAQSHDIRPVIFYIPDRKLDSFEAGVVLRDNFLNYRFVVVENEFFREPKRDVWQSPAYEALRSHRRRFVMPKLADDVVDALEDCDLSISDFMRKPLSSSGETLVPDALPPDMRIELRGWVFKTFREIHRVAAGLATDDEPPGDPGGAPWVADREDWGPAAAFSRPRNVGRRQMILSRLLSKP
jgi:hypothetical protein